MDAARAVRADVVGRTHERLAVAGALKSRGGVAADERETTSEAAASVPDS